MNTTRFAIGLVALLMIASAAAFVLSDSEQTDAADASWYSNLNYNSQIGFEMDVSPEIVEDVIVEVGGGAQYYQGTPENGHVILDGTALTSGTYSLVIYCFDSPEEGERNITLVDIQFNMGAAPAMDPLVVSEGYEYVLPNPSLDERFSGWQIDGEIYAPGQTVVITGSTEITAIYGGQPTLVGIGLVLNQEVYEVGDSPEVTVWAHWSDGDSTDVTAEAEISPETFTIDGEVVVSAKYGGITETATVMVYPAETCTVTISIENPEYGTVEVDSDVITTEAVYLVVPVGTEVVKDGDMLTIGEYTVTATPGESGAQYTYACSWGDVPGSVTEDVEIALTFTRTLNEYAVTWNIENAEVTVTYDGTTVNNGDEVPYGAELSVTVKADEGYSVTDGAVQTIRVEGPVEIRATVVINTYTVTWVNDDGTILETDEDVSYGSTPEYDGETPTKDADAQYTYTFAGWDPEIAAVTGDAVYKATYAGTVNVYTVTWQNWDGTELYAQQVSYGSTPEYDGETPTKDADAQYTYTFAGWDPEVSEVKGDTTYTAMFDAIPNKYTVTIADATNGTIIVKDDDGNVVQSGDEVDHGTHLVIEGVADTGYKLKATYVDGVQAEEVTVTSDVTISAEFVTEDTPIVFHSINVVYDGAMGSVSYPATVADGNSANVYISAGFGYVIRSVTVDGDDVQLDSKLSQTVRLTNVTSDISIVVTFDAAQQYTITVDAGRGSFLLPDGPYYEGREYIVYIDAPLGYAVDVGGTVVTGSDDYEVYSNGTIVLGGMSDDVVITVSYKLTIVDDDDDDPVVPPVVIKPDGGDDNTTYIVAIAAAAVVAILAALILMQTRKS